MEASKLALVANENVSAAVAGNQDVRDSLSRLLLDYGGVDSARWLVQHGFLDIFDDYIAELDNSWNIYGILAHPEDIVHSGDPAKALEVYRNLDVACTNLYDFQKSLFQAALKHDDPSAIRLVAQEYMIWSYTDSIFAFGSLLVIKLLKELKVFDANSPALFDWVHSKYRIHGLDIVNNPWLMYAHIPN